MPFYRKNAVENYAQVYDYLIDHSLREDAVLADLRAETEPMANAGMQISPDQGQFMALLAKLVNARRCLEIGVFTGYSSTVVAQALPADGYLLALDVSAEFTAMARKYWERAGVADRIELRIGPAGDSLAALDPNAIAPFDYCFIDADKPAYDGYYEQVLPLMRPGGLILFDNMLQHGRVADPEIHNESVDAIRALNDKLHQDDRVDLSLVPVGDGISLARKR